MNAIWVLCLVTMAKKIHFTGEDIDAMGNHSLTMMGNETNNPAMLPSRRLFNPNEVEDVVAAVPLAIVGVVVTSAIMERITNRTFKKVKGEDGEEKKKRVGVSMKTLSAISLAYLTIAGIEHNLPTQNLFKAAFGLAVYFYKEEIMEQMGDTLTGRKFEDGSVFTAVGELVINTVLSLGATVIACIPVLLASAPATEIFTLWNDKTNLKILPYAASFIAMRYGFGLAFKDYSRSWVRQEITEEKESLAM